MLRCYKPLSILKVNFFKSTFGGIRAGTNTLESFANILNCKLMLVPFTYVDVPVGTNPRRECTWAPIVKKFEKKLSSWKHKLLSLAGRVFLINFVLTSLPLFFLQRDFLWESMDGGRKIAMVSWEKICIPREKGRLGVKDISIFNKAFLT